MYNRKASLCHSLPHQFQLQLSVDFPHTTLHHQAMGTLLVALPCFQPVSHFLFYAFATPSSFAVPVLPKEPSLAPGYGKPPLVWMSLHKISKPLSKETPAPCFQMYPISVKQSSSFEEGPQETVLIHVVMHDHILITTRTLRSRDFCFKLMCNHLDSKILSSGLLLRQEETPVPTKLKIKSAKYRKI